MGKKNIARKGIYVPGQNLMPYWFFVISEHPPSIKLYGFPYADYIPYYKYRSVIKPDSVVAILDDIGLQDEWKIWEKGSRINCRDFKVLFKKGNNYILQFKGTNALTEH